ncbi:hypothetical protein Ththe16_1971 (plasmid) [Thermus thermophilus SG0.5JP17-16]|uniref:Nitroreductase domain-containing protein n=2 Tax=Thermus TaxID=270 RepID=F6DIW5_THETG|nr:hypothetical protein Ththe16_1971 [Thermus thermophilus SG0.5JP17-16]
MDPNIVVRTPRTVRLLSPSPQTGSRWVAEDWATRRRYALPLEAVVVLIRCFKPRRFGELLRYMEADVGIPLSSARSLLGQLLKASLLRDATLPETPREAWINHVQTEWPKWGWIESAEYHVATYDYQFVSSDESGLKEALSRMNRYAADEPDLNRSKSIKDAVKRIPMGAPKPADAPSTFEEVIAGTVPVGTLSKDRFLAALSISFNYTGTIPVPWKGAPLFRRTSPSGGARHPSETYVLVRNIEGLPQGWYHLDFGARVLELMREEKVDSAELVTLFPATYGRAPFPVAAIVIVTCVFERNMYRYREPRTFRTVHMDAGHLIETFELVCAANGIRCFTQYGNNDQAIEAKLGLNPLEEGYMLACAVG